LDKIDRYFIPADPIGAAGLSLECRPIAAARLVGKPKRESGARSEYRTPVRNPVDRRTSIMLIRDVTRLEGALMADPREPVLYPELAAYVGESEKAVRDIPEKRKARLGEIASYVQDRAAANRRARLVFICSHNSRRSHMAQIWAQTAAAYHGVANVDTFSGGTEATAFDARAAAALERAGFRVDRNEGDRNPVYELRYGEESPVMEAYSKVYDADPNPRRDFCAVMTCSQADQACPVVRGASARVAIPYDDPKAFDDTEEESARYDERCRQISCEMFYLFGLIER
jgi:arsenate reductase